MKLQKIIRMAISIAMLFICANLRSNPPADDTEMKQQLKVVANNVQSGSLPIEAAIKILKNVIEKAPTLTETPLFADALLACYSIVLAGDKWECYSNLSQGKLQEPLFCAIEDSFDAYNTFLSKDLESSLLRDVRVPEQYDSLDENFRFAYEYWTYAIIVWILKQRANAGDTASRDAIEEATVILGERLRQWEPEHIIQTLRELLSLIKGDTSPEGILLFQKILKIIFPHI